MGWDSFNPSLHGPIYKMMILMCAVLFLLPPNCFLFTVHHPSINSSSEPDYKCPKYSGKSSRCANRPSDFSYGNGPTGPDNWPAMYDTCAGERQSPINIDMSDLENLKVGPLQWSAAYFNTPKAMTLTNRDHTLTLKACYQEDCQPMLSGGPLHKPYKFMSANFHWGSRNSKGSEHTIDEFAYPMEMQVLHGGNDSKGESSCDLVIVAYFFQIAEEGNCAIEKILKVLVKALKHPYEPINLKRLFTLASLARPFSSEYVTYRGSITKPPCTQGIKWIVYPYPLEISTKQLDRFRVVCKYAPDLNNNYRPVQSVGERKVYFVT